MTKTAKQDAKKAPAPASETRAAATESAATEGEVQPETAAEPEETVEAAPEAAAKPELDETKRKFREALDRKQQAHNDGQGQGNRDGSKINGAHGPAASRRNFRRKSG